MNLNKTVTYALVLAASVLTIAGPSGIRTYAQGNGSRALQNQPFTASIFPACDGDTVTVTGKYSVEFQRFTASDGTLQYSYNISGHGTGTGSPSGNNYVYNVRESITAAISANGTGEETRIPLSFELISQGGGQNLYGTTLMHVTVSANGTLTAYFNDFSLTCHG